ncbi:hypothetical protein GCM10009827_037490 [Dactylosporangium maewongense]|uniref:Uncharacterized protein n=1 Tax=Dactylosporangium maewongense TaxID=634393 RepID=A0ABN2AI10_9ACTN
MTTTAQNRVESEIRNSLSESGIDSLDALVRRLASSPAAQPAHEDYLPMTEESDRNSSPEEPRPPKPHRPPEMNLVIDGEHHDPAVIAEFNGRALYSTPGFDAKREPTLYSFTTRASLHDHLVNTRYDTLRNARPETARRRNGAVLTGADDIGTSNPDSLPEISYYFEHESRQGDWLQNGPGRGWSNLKLVGRGFLNLGDWDNIISSVDWCRWDVSLFDWPGFRGGALPNSELYLRAGRTTYHLSELGWNDRASCTANWGIRG